MKSLRHLHLSELALCLVLCTRVHGAVRSGGDFEITKELVGASGAPVMNNSQYQMAFSFSEPLAAGALGHPDFSLRSGYFAGGFGNGLDFTVLHSYVGTPQDRVYTQGVLRVGVSLTAPLSVTFSDQIDESSVASGVRAISLRDHRGTLAQLEIPITTTYDRATQTLVIRPPTPWTGNTLYDLRVSSALTNLDGVPLPETFHAFFVTLLDPGLENVVLTPVLPAPFATRAKEDGAQISVHLPEKSLRDYSVVLINSDPAQTPLEIDPALIAEANRKATASGGPYRQALALKEVIAFQREGQREDGLSSRGLLKWSYGSSPFENAAVIVRPESLSMWVLDENHRLWVKLPDVRRDLLHQTIEAPITRFGVFALMTDAWGSSSDAYAFPVPWRPHGPQAGAGPGQTGTEAAGITFTNLPSECEIRIYTITGESVVELRHSDLTGPLGLETWDVKNSDGRPVSSGVYLWQVHSSGGSKSGKLMVIR